MRLALALIMIAGAAWADEALVDFTVVNGAEIPEPLVAWDGPPEVGEAVVAAAGCLGCHQKDLPALAAEKTAGRLRLALVEPTILFGETEMPAYYSVGVYGVAAEDQVGRTRLSAAEIEQVVAYLTSLDALQNPTRK